MSWSTSPPSPKPGRWSLTRPPAPQARKWRVGYSRTPVPAGASAVALAPALTIDVNLAVPPAIATAGVFTPNALVGYLFTAPVLTADAVTLVPGIASDSSVVVPIVLAAATALTPALTVTFDPLTAPLLTATATALTPAFHLDYPQTIPSVVASALALPPSASADTNAAGPTATAGATALPPTVQWLQTPEDSNYTTPGAWTWNQPAWCRPGDKIDLILYGGGRGGTKGTSVSARPGGRAGAIQSTTLTVGTDIAQGASLTGSVGTGGAANSGNGGNTTCTTIGLTALGATTDVGTNATPGESPGNRTQGTLTITGGTGGAYNAAAAGSNGTQPGAGGGGGGSIFFVGQNGGAGAPGGVYIRVRKP